MSDDHLSLDELAELDEGLLPPERISAIRAHLSGCDECQARADAITATRSMLSDLPPLPMPDEVKTRIDAALAAEPMPVGDPEGRSSDVIPDVVALPRRRMSRPSAAASAAAAAIVLAVGAIIVGHAHHKSSTATTAEGGATTAPTTNPLNLSQHNGTIVKQATGTNYNAADLANLTPHLLDSTNGTATPAASAAPPASGSAGFSAKSAGGGHTADTTSGGGTATTVPHALLPLFHSQKKLNACASAWAGTSNATPAVVDFGRWTDATGAIAPAAVLMFETNTLNTYDVWVVKADCGSSPSASDNALLHYQIVNVP